MVYSYQTYTAFRFVTKSVIYIIIHHNHLYLFDKVFLFCQWYSCNVTASSAFNIYNIIFMTNIYFFPKLFPSNINLDYLIRADVSIKISMHIIS